MKFTDEQLKGATDEGLIELARKGDPESIILIRKIQQSQLIRRISENCN